MGEENRIILGDCIEEMKKLSENSVDAIITDPPYGLEFMGKDWDKFKNAENIGGGTMENRNTPYQRGDKTPPSFYQMSKKRFGIKGEEGENDLKVKKNFEILPRFFNSDMVSFQEFTTNWAREALRVLKPGGYLLSFGGTRTYHRMACGIEDAGFEIRDCILWLYGSGFPKSLNIGKQIDKIQGNEREVIGTKQHANKDFKDNLYAQDPANSNNEKLFGYGEEEITKGNSEWEGWGTALKPAVEPIVVARKPISEKSVALNVLKWGTGGINIDECRIGEEERINKRQPVYHGNTGTFSGQGEIPSRVDKIVNGRFPANIILECTCDELEERKEIVSGGFGAMDIGMSNTGEGITQDYDPELSQKREVTYFIHTNPTCPCYMLDEQSGKTGALAPVKSGQRGWGGEIYNKFKSGGDDGKTFHDNGKLGGASRFFYCAKASKSERNFGLENTDIPEKSIPINEPHNSKNLEERYEMKSKNNHPTVKPLKLLEYLVKLISKEGAIVLDPFLGSGTTAIACVKLNRQFIGIEKEPDYIKIAEARIKPFLEKEKL
jgi:site-specific DNA-methyltransferase (adenine-specific)